MALVNHLVELLSGGRQTVPRADLTIALCLLEPMRGRRVNDLARLYADCAYVWSRCIKFATDAEHKVARNAG